MSVDITMTAGNAGGMMKLGGGDIPSLINALNSMSNDQKFRCDLIIDVDGNGDKVFHNNVNGIYSTSIITTSNGIIQYFFDPSGPSCYKREVVSGTATDTTYSTINSWTILYSDDSLGGNTYPANRVSYDNTESGLDADDVQEAIDEIAAGGVSTVISWDDWNQLTPQQQETGSYTITDCPWADGNVSVDLMTKLWENPSPTSNFSAQDVMLSSSDYDMLLIVTKYNASGNRYISSYIGNSGFVEFTDYNGNAAVMTYREIAVNGVNVTISECKINSNTDNSRLIPITIYGIKTTASVKINAIAMDVSTSADKCMMSNGWTVQNTVKPIITHNTSDLTGDLNTLTSPGTYQVGNITKESNAPSGIGTSGFIWVVRHSTYIMQWAILNEGQKHRFSFDTGSTWVNWV